MSHVEWLEDSLSPNTIVVSSAVASTAADTVIGVSAGDAALLQTGMILTGPAASGTEYMVISVIAGNSITVQRAQGGTLANSFAAGQTVNVMADAAYEGEDVVQSTPTIKDRNFNYRHACSFVG